MGGYALCAEDGEGVVPGRAGVDDEGKGALEGQGDLGRERLSLHGRGEWS